MDIETVKKQIVFFTLAGKITKANLLKNELIHIERKVAELTRVNKSENRNEH